jgi:ABC-type transport system substrate-binding protein
MFGLRPPLARFLATSLIVPLVLGSGLLATAAPVAAANPVPPVTVGGPATGVTFDPGLMPAPPTITGIVPADGARNVSRSVKIRIAMSEPTDGLAEVRDLTSKTCLLLIETVDPATMTVIITPRSRLAANHLYRVTVEYAVSLATGMNISGPFVTTFRTGSR